MIGLKVQVRTAAEHSPFMCNQANEYLGNYTRRPIIITLSVSAIGQLKFSLPKVIDKLIIQINQLSYTESPTISLWPVDAINYYSIQPTQKINRIEAQSITNFTG